MTPSEVLRGANEEFKLPDIRLFILLQSLPPLALLIVLLIP